MGDEGGQAPQTPSTPPTITVEAKLVQIVLNDEHRDGVDWEAIVSDFHRVQLKRDNNSAWSDKKYNLSVGEISSEDYAVLLDALDTVGRVSQNDFSVLALNKDETKTEDVSFDPKFLPSIKLDFTWVNSPSGDPKLKIDPMIDVILKDNNPANMIVQLKNQTQVDLKDNRTVVLGGLMHEEEIKKTRKFPLLGDLPLVGLVFRKQGRLMQKTETIIFLTMHTNSVASLPDEQK